MLKHYFTHPSVWTYIAIAAALFYYLLIYGCFSRYYWVLFIPIAIAPFFEWFAHKYILHMRIGNILEIEKETPNDYQKGQTIELETSEGKKEFEVLMIKTNGIIVGNGKAKKAPGLYKFMQKLHYGHHQDPDYVPLIFAPILSVIILFVAMFLVFLALSWSIDASLTFLFGVVVYYLHYEWMHLGHHVKGYNHIMPWSKKLKKLHSLHHYKNENYWWGITNILGDIVLGTYKDHSGIPKSKTVKDINP